MKNTITISKDILKASIEAFNGNRYEITPSMSIDNTDVMEYDKHTLLLTLQLYCDFTIDWHNNQISTNKGNYAIDEFLIKFIANGRRVGYRDEKVKEL